MGGFDPASMHWPADQYRLLDFGDARKLEEFAGIRLDRPSPAAEGVRRAAVRHWAAANYQLQAERWMPADPAADAASAPSEPWSVEVESLTFNLKLTPFGHVGLFPEQIACWRWLREQIAARQWPVRPVGLNLFGYTGGSSLMLARAGVEVVHVDASAPAVTWARQNARSSQLEQHPIRWIVDDARKFVQREQRRQRQYDIVVLDPPSYGHGPQGNPWLIEEHLPQLLRDAAQLLRQHRNSLLLLTGHSERPGAEEICDWVKLAWPAAERIEHGRLGLVDSQQRTLDAGFFIIAQDLRPET